MMPPSIIILSGSKLVGLSLFSVISKLLLNTKIEFSDDATKSTFLNYDLAILDLMCPCKILGDFYVSDVAEFQDVINKMNKNYGRISCLFFGSPEDPPKNRFLLTSLFRKLKAEITNNHIRKEHEMSSNGTATAWHNLKNDYSDHSLKILEACGFGYKADKYQKLWNEGKKEEAKQYANEEYTKNCVKGSSRVTFHRSLQTSSSRNLTKNREIGILLVDDQEYWLYDLQYHIEGFNATSEEYSFADPKFSKNAEQAKSAILSPNIHAVILDYDLSGDKKVNSKELSKYIKEMRPDVSIFGLTGVMPSEAYTQDWIVDRVFYKSDAAEIYELLLAIIEAIREKTLTPFFSALCELARRPTAVFHAMPLSRAKSVAGSQWTREFAEFYGEGYFAGETSSTMPPLDSLFHPKHSLRNAMDRASKVFYADRTLFVTNGTTGGNSIVYGIHIKPGDLILLDRNCHRSHHYSTIQCGAKVAYMEPEHIDQYGISSIVPITRILETVERYKENVKMLVLTHPTFDGVCYSPYEIIRQVMKIKKDIIFLFDEAWFAYGVFHYVLRDRSAMAASLKLRSEGLEPRVYVTQSIHKTLSAMRQGSMVHIREPIFTDEIESAIEESINSHVSTSPNAHVLGSIDVARMQAEIEGYDRLSKAFNIASWIRNEFDDRDASIYALQYDDLVTPLLKKEAQSFLDPLKITLNVKGMPAAKFKKEEMYGKMGIQINKYSQNTILALVTIGTTWSMADHLVRSLRKWQTRKDKGNDSDIEVKSIPSFSGFDKRFYSIDESVGLISHASAESHVSGKTKKIKFDTCEGKTSAVFVMPYPPGYPILVPGQRVDAETIEYIRSLRAAGVEVGDIHGMDENECLRVFLN